MNSLTNSLTFNILNVEFFRKSSKKKKVMSDLKNGRRAYDKEYMI